ncbi:Vitamin K epoxide reductase complex subunit 1 [Trichostrongylus colubriformis]|uniref:vitamin-K-epoxide reductase (warfarin-sensitive) n=1 Tax=Trichostrongylus colubriformis TaxID=6319 RepID=A0AAN8F5G7_TRICO
MAITASQWANEATVATRRALYALLAGLIISMYGLYVEIRFEMDHEYSAMCDVSSLVSCTRVMTSKYGSGFGIVGPLLGEDSPLNQRNALYGVIGYATLALIQFSHTQCSASISLVAAILMNIMSLYLLTILIKLRAVCLVCVAIYTVNAVFLYFTAKRCRALSEVTKINNNKKRK